MTAPDVAALTPTALAYPQPNGSARTGESVPVPPRSLLLTNLTYPADVRPNGPTAGVPRTDVLPALPSRQDWFDTEAAVVSRLSGSPGAVAAAVAALAARAAAYESKTAALVGVAIRIKTSLGW